MFDDSMESIGLKRKKKNDTDVEDNGEYNMEHIKSVLRESDIKNMDEKDKMEIKSTKMKMRDEILSVIWMWMLFAPNNIKKVKLEQVPWIEEWKQTNKDISVHRILTHEITNVQTLLKPFFPSKMKIIEEITGKIFMEHQKIQLNQEMISKINEKMMCDLGKMYIQ